MPDPADPPRAPEDPPEQHPDPEPAQRARVRSGDWRAFASANASALLAAGFLAAGVVFVLLGWYGAAHTNIITEQIPYLISGGLLGLGMIIVAGFMAFTAVAERDNRRLRDELGRALRTGGFAAQPSAGDPGPSSNGRRVFVLPGGKSYHEAGCPIIEGKQGVEDLVPAEARRGGYAPCKLCDAGD